MARLVLGCLYSVSVPVWEAYDEDSHYAYGRYLARRQALPRAGDPEAERIWERFQPPLYYALSAPVIAALDVTQGLPEPERNPYWSNGDAGYNYALHPDRLDSDSRSVARAVLAARFVGICLSAASVIAVYSIASRLWPGERLAVWTAVSLYAFWPQFLFVGSVVTNDGLITALSAVVLSLVVRLSMQGFRVRHVVALVVVLGAALLTKLNALALIPVAGATLVASRPVARGSGARLRWLALGVLGGAVLGLLRILQSLELVAGQLLRVETISRFLRYADPGSGLSLFRFTAVALNRGFRSFIAAFGWGNLEAFDWLYWAWLVGACLSVGGLSVAFLRRDVGTQFRVLGLMMLLVVSLVGLNLALALAQQDVFLVEGRYLLPALPGVACLLVAGWRALLPSAWRRYVWKAVSLAILLVSWSIPFMVIAPAYAKPQPLRDQSGIMFPRSFVFGEQIEFLGYSTPLAGEVGEDLHVTLCWRALAPIHSNYSVRLEVAGLDGEVYTWLESYPGRGNYPTSFWAIDTPFCDDYAVPIWRPIPENVRLAIALLIGPGGERLSVTNGLGQPNGRQVWVPVDVEPAY